MTEDLVEGVIELLKADTDVASFVSTRVFGLELPRAEADGQPRKAIVVDPSGGAPPPWATATVKLQVERVDLRCLGENAYEAARVRRAAYAAMKGMQRVVHAGVLLHWARAAGGPIAIRDADTDWPAVTQPWQVAADERTAA